MRGEDLHMIGEAHGLDRITPACAGKTITPMHRGGHLPDRPRMRGEDAAAKDVTSKSAGSPPHARGRRRHCEREYNCSWITPACAGKTQFDQQGAHSLEDHPRMRGEDG